MSRDDKINRIATRAAELAEENEPEETATAQLRWIARDDHQLLDDAMEAALAADGSLQQRQAAIELIARARYPGSEDAITEG